MSGSLPSLKRDCDAISRIFPPTTTILCESLPSSPFFVILSPLFGHPERSEGSKGPFPLWKPARKRRAPSLRLRASLKRDCDYISTQYPPRLLSRGSLPSSPFFVILSPLFGHPERSEGSKRSVSLVEACPEKTSPFA